MESKVTASALKSAKKKTNKLSKDAWFGSLSVVFVFLQSLRVHLIKRLGTK